MTRRPARLCGFTRGLRFRLAFSYVFFFTILLVFLGIVFRQTLSATFQSQMESVLDEEWGAAKGYLRTGPEGPDWFYDENDPDEVFTVERVQPRLSAGRHRRVTRCSTPRSTIPSASILRRKFRAILESGKPAIRMRTDSKRDSLHDPLRLDGGSAMVTNTTWRSAGPSITTTK